MPWSADLSQTEEELGGKLHCTFILLALHVLQPIEGFPQYTISNIYRRLGCFWVESYRLYVLDGPMRTDGLMELVELDDREAELVS